MNIVPRLDVLVCHDSPLVGAGVHATLAREPDLAVTLADGSSAALEATQADVVIADYLTALRWLDVATVRARSRLLILTDKVGEWDVRRAMTRGVPGYLLLGSPAERVVHAVRTLARGGRCYDDAVSARIADSLMHATLTRREHDVLDLLSQGVGNKHIARTLDIQLGTVKTHVKAILDKLEVRTRTQAVVVAEHRGMIRAAAE